jgi:NRAMP (natural resistance-associated macrophage protein)-like metal ion transporter
VTRRAPGRTCPKLPTKPDQPSPAKRKLRWLRDFGPGLITGASDDDPSGIATYSQAGAQLGFTPSWVMVLVYPLMAAIQEISARIGRTSGRGLAANIQRHYPPWVAQLVVLALSVANIINIGADLGAMGDAVRLLIGGPVLLYTLVFGLVCAAVQILMTYARYVAVLKWLSLSLLGYFATLAMVHVPWGEVLHGLLVPTFATDARFWSTLVALLGTTISPYLFFWQSSQEVEEIDAVPEREALIRKPRQADSALERIRVDTYTGMAFSNLVALAIIITTAATLHASHITNIQTAAQAAASLQPLAGRYASALFALGIISTGLLAVPVLAGSFAYALAETRGWPLGLARLPSRAKAFYATIGAATLGGALLNFSPLNPIKALYWSAVINGVVAVPVMVIMMLLSRDRRVMGQFAVTGWLRALGWLATAIMAGAAIALLLSFASGQNG